MPNNPSKVKQIIVAAVFCAVTALVFRNQIWPPAIAVNLVQDGDIIFQTSKSRQSEAIQLATHSKYSHMGILFHDKKSWFVYEAVGPVKFTPLSSWIDRGVDKHYVVKRLKEANGLTPQMVSQLKTAAEWYRGKPYDLYFGWSNARIYCSELVWKAYKEGLNIELGKLQRLHDFDLTSPAVKSMLKERYGNAVPLNEHVVAPCAIFDSNQLTTVCSG